MGLSYATVFSFQLLAKIKVAKCARKISLLHWPIAIFGAMIAYIYAVLASNIGTRLLHSVMTGSHRSIMLTCSISMQGLQPGTYRYKFIVDGMWVVDVALPAECDNEGNTNNVVHVPDFSPQTLKPNQAASFIRVEAARMALAAKFGVGQSKRRSRQ